MKLKILLLFALIMLLSTVARAQVEKSSNFGSFSIHVDNDLFTFARTDRDYTSGIKLAWNSPSIKDYHKNHLLKWLPFVNKPGFKHEISISVGHNIYTPSDIMSSDLIKDDRPYAGILYFKIGIHSRSTRRMDTLEINLGIVGPSSCAEKIQKTIHKLFKSPYPNGWDHQLKDELAFALIYERKLKALQSSVEGSFGFDLIPHLGCGFGNLYTYANTGMQFRIGWNLPDDFGPTLIQPGGDPSVGFYKSGPSYYKHSWFGIHAFVGLDGHVVLRNIFLDGNTFMDSHRVDKKLLIADIIGGIGLRIWRFKLNLSYVFMTKQFKTQKHNQTFGSINLSYSY